MTPDTRLVPVEAVQRLILAADSYGVRYLDSDDMSEQAEELQAATEAMKDILAAPALPAAETAPWVARVMECREEYDGFWRACSGCQESVDGHVSQRDYPYSAAFGCQPGGGCGECGGLGVIWDTTDYDAMADDIIADMKSEEEATAHPAAEAVDDAFGDALVGLLLRHGLKVALDVSEIEALRQSAIRAQSSEPVAWRWRWKAVGPCVPNDWRYGAPTHPDQEVQPLYPHPHSHPAPDTSAGLAFDLMKAQRDALQAAHAAMRKPGGPTLDDLAAVEAALSQGEA